MNQTKLDHETRDVLTAAAHEIRGLRNQVQLQRAKLEVLELFDIALRGRQGGELCAGVDTAWRIDRLIEQDDMREEHPAPENPLGPFAPCLACGGYFEEKNLLHCPGCGLPAREPQSPNREPNNEAIEKRAEELYNKDLSVDDDGRHRPWIPGGNSLKQQEAREMARAEFGG